MEMGNRIKTLRLAKSMTQEQLARALHVSAQAVSKWELGGSLPDIQLLPALSVVLGTSIDALFSLTDESRLARIDNMLEDRRFLTQHEFETEERFLQEKCMEGSENVRAVLLLARLYCKRAGEYRALASPLARRALELDPQSKEAHTAVFAAENGAYPDWNVSNHSETIAFYKDFLAHHPEEYGAYLWLLDLLLADGRCGEAREYAGRLRAIRESFNDELYRGILCKQEGRIGEALDCWAAMCEKYGDMWQAWASRASELAKLCRYDEAARSSASFAATARAQSAPMSGSFPSCARIGASRRASCWTRRCAPSRACGRSLPQRRRTSDGSDHGNTNAAAPFAAAAASGFAAFGRTGLLPIRESGGLQTPAGYAIVFPYV